MGKSKDKLELTSTSWNPQGWAKTTSVLTASDLDVVGILQEKTVSFNMELNTHLGPKSEELEDPGKGGVVASLSASPQQRSEPANKQESVSYQMVFALLLSSNLTKVLSGSSP